MLLGCALLCACGAAPSAGQNLQEQYAAVKTAQLEAEVVCHLEGESRSYTVQCSYDRGGDAVTTITTPEELAGISATVSGSDLTLTYDGTGLAAGPLRDVCAANCLPLLLRAVSDGYILEQGKETIEGQPCLRLALDATLPSGEKVLCTGWFYGADLTPCYAEFSLPILRLKQRRTAHERKEENTWNLHCGEPGRRLISTLWHTTTRRCAAGSGRA